MGSCDAVCNMRHDMRKMTNIIRQVFFCSCADIIYLRLGRTCHAINGQDFFIEKNRQKSNKRLKDAAYIVNEPWGRWSEDHQRASVWTPARSVTWTARTCEIRERERDGVSELYKESAHASLLKCKKLANKTAGCFLHARKLRKNRLLGFEVSLSSISSCAWATVSVSYGENLVRKFTPDEGTCWR